MNSKKDTVLNITPVELQTKAFKFLKKLVYRPVYYQVPPQKTRPWNSDLYRASHLHLVYVYQDNGIERLFHRDFEFAVVNNQLLFKGSLKSLLKYLSQERLT